MNKKEVELYSADLDSNSNRFVLTCFQPDNMIELIAKNHFIVFLTKGRIRISIEKNESVVVTAPAVYLIPKGKYYERVTLESSDIVVFPFTNQLDISYFSVENFIENNHEEQKMTTSYSESVFVLKIEPVLMQYIDLLKESYQAGFTDDAFFSLKIKELMFLFERIYTRQERFDFFYPILDKESDFTDVIYNNYKKVRTVKELADLSYYSLSGFEKKFRRIFGVSPSKWLKQRLSMAIFHEITKTSKSFKEVSLDYGFSSPSHFNNFCKELLGEPPGELRKKFIEKNRNKKDRW